MARLRAVQAAWNVLKENQKKVYLFVGKAQGANQAEQTAALHEYQRIMSGLADEAKMLMDQMIAEALKDDPLKNGGSL